MSASLARVGFALAAAGQLAYIPQQSTLFSVVTTFVAAGGFAAAAAAPTRGRLLVTGLALAAAAAISDLITTLSGGFEIWLAAQALWTLGVVMTVSSARSGGHDFGVRAGAATAAFGSSLWVLLDPFNAVTGWLPGNVLSVAGFALVAHSFDSAPPAAKAVETPA